jgi:hypothetical protein
LLCLIIIQVTQIVLIHHQIHHQIILVAAMLDAMLQVMHQVAHQAAQRKVLQKMRQNHQVRIAQITPAIHLQVTQLTMHQTNREMPAIPAIIHQIRRIIVHPKTAITN